MPSKLPILVAIGGAIAGAAGLILPGLFNPKPKASEDATVVAFDFPAAMAPGARTTARVVVRNIGKDPWSAPDVKLGAVGDLTGDASKFLSGVPGGDPARVVLNPGEVVNPGATREFKFDVVAPAQGTYMPAFRMVHEGLRWFGGGVARKVVVSSGVPTPPPPPPPPPPVSMADDAKIVSMQIPATMKAGEPGTWSVEVENTGTATWDDSWRLGVVNDMSGDACRFTEKTGQEPNRFHLGAGKTVAKGDHVTFTFPVIAPDAQQPYSIQLQMVHEGVQWFGQMATTTCTVAGVYQAPHRTGMVRAEGHSLADDQGRFFALGATLMWAAWGYKNDRPKLEAALDYLSKNGYDYIRCLGVVGDVNGPDYWDGREIDWRDPQYPNQIAGLTDLAYDKYGLRIEWTLIGDGQKNIPNMSDRYKLCDTFLAMSKGREQKIMHFEVANEAWQNGFGGSTGYDDLRALTKYMNDRTDILVAASALDDDAKSAALYAGGSANVGTYHFDRDTGKADGHWRPVRQPWGYWDLTNIPAVGSNNEPIGPGSSVNTEDDPVKLVAAQIVSRISQLALHVFHSKAGVRGDVDIWNMAGASSFKHIKAMLPNDICNWARKNAHWADAPFAMYAKDQSGNYVPGAWTDFGSNDGCVRTYAAVNGNDFVAYPFGIKGAVQLEPRRGVEFDVIDPMNGNVIDHQSRNAGEKFLLSGAEHFLLKGHYR